MKKRGKAVNYDYRMTVRMSTDLKDKVFLISELFKTKPSKYIRDLIKKDIEANLKQTP